MSLTGGTGKVTGVLFGALLMTVVLNSMTLLAVTPELKQSALFGLRQAFRGFAGAWSN